MTAKILPFRPGVGVTPVHPECAAEIIDFPQPMPAESEMPIFEVRGPRGSVDMFQRKDGWVTIDAVFPFDTGLHVYALIGSTPEGRWTDLRLEQPERGPNVALQACVSVEAARAVMDLLQPPPMAA